MNVDDMLALSGDMGRYQYLLMALFSVINVLSAFHYFAQTFISLEPEHWCAGSGLECMEPDLNVSMRACSSGWQYNLTGGFNTAVSELNWVCDDNWKPAVGQSLFFVGSVVGTLGLGIMADHIGRLPVLVLANVLASLGNVATSFTYGLTDFAASRLLAGLATDSNFFMMYIIGTGTKSVPSCTSMTTTTMMMPKSSSATKGSTKNMRKTPATTARERSTRTKEGILSSSAWNPDNLRDQRAHSLADKRYIKE